MIIYGLLKALMFVIGVIGNIFGGLIPSFPSSINTLLETITTMINGGVSFLSYFFYVPVITALISLVISWHGFKVAKDAIMKVLGHFFAN